MIDNPCIICNRSRRRGEVYLQRTEEPGVTLCYDCCKKLPNEIERDGWTQIEDPKPRRVAIAIIPI